MMIFFRAIDAIDISQVANIVKQGKTPKKGDQRLDTYLSKVIASTYIDQIKDKATNLTIDELSGPIWAIDHIIKKPLSRLILENV